MSKLEELINELCPNGVEYKKLKEIKKESFWLMPSTPRYISEGIPYITSKNIKNGILDLKNVSYVSIEDYERMSVNRKVEKNDILISMIGTIGEVTIVDIDRAFYGQNVYLVRLNQNIIINKYYYYYITQEKIKNNLISRKNASSQGYIKAGSIEDMCIPVPPLEVQSEIIRILDDFTLLLAELSAELKARQKQYEYYRERLLTFEEDIPKFKLLELVEFRNGKGHEKNIEPNGKYIVVNSKFISTDGKVKKYSDSQSAPLYKDDVLMVMSDLPNGRALAKCFIVGEDEKYTLNQRIGAFKVKDNKIVDTRFLYYILNRNKQLLRYDNGVDQTNLRKDDILDINIFVPKLEEQKRIVDILDRFDKICNDVSEGLPAEIEARQKQYEYYRDKLLTFKELEINE